jgi:hypothetical protein
MKSKLNLSNEMIKNQWFDGICKKCGSKVYEFPNSFPQIKGFEYSDYINYCSNENCKEHKFHGANSCNDEGTEYFQHNTDKDVNNG